MSLLRSFTLLALTLSAAASLGCSSDDTSPHDTGTGPGGTGGGGGGGGAGGGEGGAAPIGGDRPVDVLVPSGYQEGTPTPLVILLHGYSASGMVQELYFGLRPLAESRGFLYAYPDGTTDAQGKRFWNASDACCDFGSTGVDDSAYLRGVVDEIKARYTVDDRRVFFLGHSNGGFMSYRMACDHADVVAAIASLAGAMPGDLAACAASGPVSVLQIHGTADDVILYDGGDLLGNPYPGARESVERWVTRNGCAATPVAGAALDLEPGLAGEETSVDVYGGCAPGGDAELWSIAGGSHVPALGPAFAPSVIDFLLAHPRP